MGTCERCGSSNLVSIQVQLTDETKLEFRICQRCESKSWVGNGDSISLQQVLELTSASRAR